MLDSPKPNPSSPVSNHH